MRIRFREHAPRGTGYYQTILAKRHPDIRILACADDDYQNPKNPGVAAARAVAAAVSGAFVIPRFPEGRDARTDFNDPGNFPGSSLETVKEQIGAALEEASWGGPKAWLGAPGEGGKRRRAGIRHAPRRHPLTTR